jgi:hypothetical protein
MSTDQLLHVWECLADHRLVKIDVVVTRWQPDATRETPHEPIRVEVSTWCRLSADDGWGMRATWGDYPADSIPYDDIYGETIETIRLMAGERRWKRRQADLALREELADLMMV